MSGPLPPEGPRPGWPTSPPVAQPLPPPALSPGAFPPPDVAGPPVGPAGAPSLPQAWPGPPHYAPTPVVTDPRWSASKMFLVVWGLASLVGPFLGVVAGLAFVAVLGVYDVTKAALIHLTKQLAAELAPQVRVNAIAPGLVKTDFARVLWEKGRGEKVAQAYPLKRLGEVEDA